MARWWRHDADADFIVPDDDANADFIAPDDAAHADHADQADLLDLRSLSWGAVVEEVDTCEAR